MAFLTTIPQELASVAARLQAIGSALEAQVAGAASPTSIIAPAGSDSVSQLQSGIFSSYGTLFQQLAAEANTIQQQFASTLGLSSGSYSQAEATNAAVAALPGGNLVDTISTLLGGPLTSLNGNPLSLSGNAANILNIGGGNYASAASALLGLAGGGLLPTDAGEAAIGDAAGAALAGDTAPVAGGGMGGVVPVAGMGGATMVGNKLSVPPSWASAAPAITSPATAIRTVGWTAAPGTTGAGGIIPGMPGMAGGRNSSGFGAPRYGVKPLVMPKLTAV
jgi:PE family/PPE-SVP subfamily C-terminal region